jgi:glutaredoxin 1
MRWVDIQQEGISKADLEKTVGKPVLTVPQIFHGQTHVGGYTELNEYIKTLEAA